jgi:apolipoprotein D and lipocalin family protein
MRKFISAVPFLTLSLLSISGSLQAGAVGRRGESSALLPTGTGEGGRSASKGDVLESRVFTAVPADRASDRRPVRVAPSVDLARYAGKWYEIARLPNRFQRDCASDTTATYTLRPDGKVTVVNECRGPDGRLKSAKGTARVASSKEPNTKLKVTFFWPFYGDYWIIDLDPEYRWAVVGEPDRKYLWILSRKPTLDEVLYSQILDRVKNQGYDIGPLLKTRHTP